MLVAAWISRAKASILPRSTADLRRRRLGKASLGQESGKVGGAEDDIGGGAIVGGGRIVGIDDDAMAAGPQPLDEGRQVGRGRQQHDIGRSGGVDHGVHGVDGDPQVGRGGAVAIDDLEAGLLVCLCRVGSFGPVDVAAAQGERARRAGRADQLAGFDGARPVVKTAGQAVGDVVAGLGRKAPAQAVIIDEQDTFHRVCHHPPSAAALSLARRP